eukprot:gnl/Dysnectes_brevis/1044_a1164_1665.p1 GENE.gnl/Dysnectes_brevis/1044_a1164_1665~~gnl/Dysnectes_brevis/1044_a1164_1665.p1  ORF type:complete len:524 (-),score=207.14 gnl/Dysnectes_brevis/1044_a1164_1665:464-2035(-)
MEPQPILLSTTSEFDTYTSKNVTEMIYNISLSSIEDEDERRGSLDIIAVVDKSGSMSGAPIRMVKATLDFIADALSERDRFSIVSYGDSSSIDMPLNRMDASGKQQATRSISRIKAGGKTALCGALVRALDVMASASNPRDVRAVLLLTDGIANIGPSETAAVKSWMHYAHQSVLEPAVRFDPYSYLRDVLRSGMTREALEEMMGEPLPRDFNAEGDGVAAREDAGLMPPDYQAQRPIPCVVNTFGFGADHESEFLEELATEAGGAYFYIRDEEEIRDAFADCVGGLLSTIATGMRLTVEARAGRVLEAYHSSFPSAMEGAVLTVELGDLQGEEDRDLLVRVRVPPGPNGEVQVGEVTLNYLDVASGQNQTATAPLMLIRAPEGSAQPKPTVQLQRMRLEGVAALRVAQEHADGRGNFAEAKRTLQELITRITAVLAPTGALHGRVDAMELLGALRDEATAVLPTLRDRVVWEAEGQNMLRQTSCSYAMQRSNAGGQAFKTKRKSRFVRRSKAYHSRFEDREE